MSRGNINNKGGRPKGTKSESTLIEEKVECF